MSILEYFPLGQTEGGRNVFVRGDSGGAGWDYLQEYLVVIKD